MSEEGTLGQAAKALPVLLAVAVGTVAILAIVYLPRIVDFVFSWAGLPR